jgi:hypothetical protein
MIMIGPRSWGSAAAQAMVSGWSELRTGHFAQVLRGLCALSVTPVDRNHGLVADTAAVRTTGLSKSYRGVAALSDVNLHIDWSQRCR